MATGPRHLHTRLSDPGRCKPTSVGREPRGTRRLETAAPEATPGPREEKCGRFPEGKAGGEARSGAPVHLRPRLQLQQGHAAVVALGAGLAGEQARPRFSAGKGSGALRAGGLLAASGLCCAVQPSSEKWHSLAHPEPLASGSDPLGLYWAHCNVRS